MPRRGSIHQMYQQAQEEIYENTQDMLAQNSLNSLNSLNSVNAANSLEPLNSKVQFQ